MAGTLNVDWDDLGVVKNSTWTDSETFVNIAIGYAEVEGYSSWIKEFDQPGIAAGGSIENAGMQELTKALEHVSLLLKDTNFELSDACATLGSGTEQAARDYDAGEQQATADYNFISSRMAEIDI